MNGSSEFSKSVPQWRIPEIQLLCRAPLTQGRGAEDCHSVHDATPPTSTVANCARMLDWSLSV
eukprot:6779239-Prymnesium_polylepis.1